MVALAEPPLEFLFLGANQKFLWPTAYDGAKQPLKLKGWKNISGDTTSVAGRSAVRYRLICLSGSCQFHHSNDRGGQ